jgi:hypothetical protein
MTDDDLTPAEREADARGCYGDAVAALREQFEKEVCVVATALYENRKDRDERLVSTGLAGTMPFPTDSSLRLHQCLEDARIAVRAIHKMMGDKS